MGTGAVVIYDKNRDDDAWDDFKPIEYNIKFHITSLETWHRTVNPKPGESTIFNGDSASTYFTKIIDMYPELNGISIIRF